MKMKFNHSEICAVCGKGPEDFVSKRAYKLHQKNKSHAKILLTCDQCDKSFTTKTRLNMHKKRFHIAKTFDCSQCNKTFASVVGKFLIRTRVILLITL